MKSTPSKRRLVENEKQFREINERTHGGFTTVNDLAHEYRQQEFAVDDGTPVYFYCECSNADCVKRLLLTFREYGLIHRERDSYIVVPGHEILKVERVISRQTVYSVVQKLLD